MGKDTERIANVLEQLTNEVTQLRVVLERAIDIKLIQVKVKADKKFLITPMIKGWFKAYPGLNLHGMVTTDAYALFVKYCASQGLVPFSKNIFTRRLRHEGYGWARRKVNGKIIQYYVNE